MTNSSLKRRWYDQNQETALFIESIQLFPNDVQSLICEVVVNYAETEFQVEEFIQNYKTMGRERLQALYQSKNKRRWYDSTSSLHKLMNYNQYMSPPNLASAMYKAHEIITATKEYFTICKMYDREPALDQVREIAAACIKDGRSQAFEYLENIKSVYEQTAASNTDKSSSLFIDEAKLKSNQSE